MTLNALEVDPGKVWRAPWRWYHESMLDCCRPLDEIRQVGISLADFTCLAACNRLRANVTFVDSNPDDISSFRSAVIASVESNERVLVSSYDRSVLGQTGTGHFSPIGAYHQASDRALILDVARFKYPPHWVTVEMLWRAMSSTDSVAQRSRGRIRSPYYSYVELQLQPNTRPLAMFQLHEALAQRAQAYEPSVEKWTEFLRSADTASISVENAMQAFRLSFADCDMCRDVSQCCCTTDCKLKEELARCCAQICAELKATRVFGFFSGRQSANRSPVVLTALFLCWPLEGVAAKELREKLEGFVNEETAEFCSDTTNELNQLRTQISVMLLNRACDL